VGVLSLCQKLEIMAFENMEIYSLALISQCSVKVRAEVTKKGSSKSLLQLSKEVVDYGQL